MKKMLMEFLGTFFLVLTIAMGNSPIIAGMMLMAWLYIGGYVSGAHYNPLVSFAITLIGHLKWKEFYHYVAAQICGGFVAYVAASFLYGNVMLPTTQAPLLQSFLVETLLAFILASVVLHTAVSKHASHIYGLAIGLTLLALVAIGAPISGGVFNPAIAIGAAGFSLVSRVSIVLSNVIMYVVSAMCGGYLAARAYNYFLPANER